MNNNNVVFKFLIWFLIGISIQEVNCTGDSNAETLEYQNENDGSGKYRFKFLTSNGIAREEKGTLDGSGHPVVEGSYSFQSPDGNKITVFYVADDKGYRTTLPESSQNTDTEYPIQEILSAPSPALIASILGR